MNRLIFSSLKAAFFQTDKLDREDLASQVDFLKTMDKMEDRGPVADVICWNNGSEWM